jgi:hypothetical protein
LILKHTAFDRVLGEVTGGTYEEWQDRLPKQKFKAHHLKTSLQIDIETKKQENKASNVVAMFPGNDSTLKDEWIVLTAHYDHLGAQEDSAKAHYSILMGLFDNPIADYL